jgi:malonyl-CoA O-methyltransferase
MDDPAEHALDARAIRRAFDRASATYDAAAVLQARVRDELLARLGLLGFEPGCIVDLGCGTGHATRALRDRWRDARVIAIDHAPRMLAAVRARQGWFRRFDRVCADAARLPLRDGSVDLVWSSLMLPWADDPDAVLGAVRRVLAPRGYFTFATLGPDTLRELREAWGAVDAHVHVHRFLEMHDLGDALVRAGFADPVLDVERVTLTYADLGALVADLRATGSRNAAALRPRGLGGRGRRRDLEAAYERFRIDGRLPATCEIVYGQAWAPGERPPIRGRRGEAVVPIGSIGRRTPLRGGP